MITTDVLVIGAGPGGYVAAIKLGKLGKKVLLVERDRLGGECLNYGCIPSKALIASVGLYHKAKKAAEIGLSVDGLRLDWAKAVAAKAALVGAFTKNVASLCRGNGVEVLMGEARFTARRKAAVQTAAGEETVAFSSAVIVTGSRPVGLPGFAIDGVDVLSSKEALDLTEVPARLLVIGGGVIGLEIGTLYAKLGSQVSVVEVLGQLLPGVEADLVAPVARALGRLGVAVHLQSKAMRYERKGGALEVALETPEGPQALAADKILLSVGRAANTDGLGLEAAGVVKDPKGFLSVDERQQTNVPGIYAAGDVTGPPYLAHKASREGILAALAIAGAPPQAKGAVPSAIFTDPEIAFVGMSEAEARAREREVAVGRFPFLASGRAQAGRETAGFVKIVADKATDRLLGVGIVGPSASDLIGEAALALRLGATAHDLAATIHPHPTLPEALQESAEAAFGQAIHILARK